MVAHEKVGLLEGHEKAHLVDSSGSVWGGDFHIHIQEPGKAVATSMAMDGMDAVDGLVPPSGGLRFPSSSNPAASSAMPSIISSTVETHDVCFVFPDTLRKNAPMSLQERERLLTRICLRRRPDTPFRDLQSPDSLHDMYEPLKELLVQAEVTRQEFLDVLCSGFEEWLRVEGCSVAVHRGTDAKHVFMLAKLQPAAAERLAETFEYPLQVDRLATSYDELKQNEDFIPPFDIYDKSIEKRRAGPMLTIGRVWERYDRLNQPIYERIVDVKNPDVYLFRDVDRIRLLMDVVRRAWDLELLAKRGFLEAHYPLEQPLMEEALYTRWASLRHCWHLKIPMREVRNYFGEQVALYFAWMQLYTRMLVSPAIAGGILYVLQLVMDTELDYGTRWLNWLRAGYSLFIMCWVTLLFQAWSRKERKLQLQWGSRLGDDVILSGEVSHSFKPDGFERDPILPQRWTPTYSAWKAALRRVFTWSVTAICICISMVLVNNDLCEAILKYFVAPMSKGPQAMFETAAKVCLVAESTRLVRQIGSAFSAVMIRLFDRLWERCFAYNLALFENKKYSYEVRSSFTMKLFSFKFLDYFSVLVYFAFFKEHIIPCTDMPDGRCIRTTRRQLVMIFLVGLFSTIVSQVVPLILMLGKFCRRNLVVDDSVPTYEKQLKQADFNSFAAVHGWSETFIQFGLVTLFSMVFPALPLLALVINGITIRVEAKNLLTMFRRPYPEHPTGTSTEWVNIMRSISFLAVLSNVFLCIFVTVGKDWKLVYQLAASLALMLLGLAVKDFIQYRVPVENEEIKVVKGRMHFVLHEVLRG